MRALLRPPERNAGHGLQPAGVVGGFELEPGEAQPAVVGVGVEHAQSPPPHAGSALPPLPCLPPHVRGSTSESRAIVHALNAVAADVSFVEIKSDKGHDAFLLDEPEFHAVLSGFLAGSAELAGLAS